jgi:Fe-S-cluster containining protein
LDCEACGACCVICRRTRRRGFTSWVEIEQDAKLLGRADLVRKLVVRDAAGVAHLRVAGDGRCLALRGAIGRRVKCDVYALRPHACRRVQPGDAWCLRYRREHQLT